MSLPVGNLAVRQVHLGLFRPFGRPALLDLVPGWLSPAARALEHRLRRAGLLRPRPVTRLPALGAGEGLPYRIQLEPQIDADRLIRGDLLLEVSLDRLQPFGVWGQVGHAQSLRVQKKTPPPATIRK
jgi:hypothetical protein